MREHRRAWLGIVVVVVSACAAPSSVRCPDGSDCPEGTRCVQTGTAIEDIRCATPLQDAGCADLVDGDSCTEPAPGTCIGGACFPSVCGDGIQDGPEQCDDGNVLSGDGCAGDCGSREVCGNDIVDLEAAAPEQCDGGVPGLAGDGCSSECQSEYLLWRAAAPSPPRLRSWPLVVPGTGGDDVLVIGGGVLAPATALGEEPPTLSDVFADVLRWDGWAWTRVAAPATPPARGAAAGALDPQRQRVVVFGGLGDPALAAEPHLADTWEWDGVSWRDRTPATPSPPARAAGVMACAPGACVLFGGIAPGRQALGDTWIWDGATWTELAITGPSPRFGAALAFDPTSGAKPRFVLVGGVAGRVAQDDTWELTATRAGGTWTASWTELSAITPPALVRGNPQAMYAPPPAGIDGNGAVYLVGDQGGNDPTALWRLDAAGWQLVDSVAASEDAAGRIVGANLDRRRGTVVAVPAGLGGALESKGGPWVALANPRFSDYGQGDFVAAYDPLRAATIVLLGDVTLAWDGQTLRKLPLDTQPPAAIFRAMAYDERCQQLVAFGGITFPLPTIGGVTDATWRLTDSGWVPVTRTGAWPPARRSAAMTYDAARQRVLLHGGADLVTELADLWELTGPCDAPTWQRVTTDEAPGARAGASLTYDPVRGTVVLFGGGTTDDTGDRLQLADLWELDGTTWTRRWEPGMGAGPAPRALHGAAFDVLTGRLLVVGGFLGEDDASDTTTWAWDGATWQALPVVVEPPPFSWLHLARAPRGMIAFGTTYENPQRPAIGGFARLSSEQIADLPETCALAEDADGDGLTGCEDPDCWARCTPLCPPAREAAACTTARCGDGTCTPPREDYLLCLTDCPAPL